MKNGNGDARKKSFLYKIFPFLCWFKDYSFDYLKNDLIAGTTVALVLIPQSMAYAQLANLPAYYGLYAAFLPPIAASLFGSSRQLATGPVAIVSLMTATALEPLATAGSEQFIMYAIFLAIIVGAFQFLLGVFRLGFIVNFLSHPVVTGFTNAAALIIAASQFSKLFGVSVEKADHTYITVYRIICEAVSNAHLPTLGMAILAFAIMFGVKKINPRLPYVLIAVTATTLISWGTGFEKKIVADVDNIDCPQTEELLSSYNSLYDKLDSLASERVKLNAKLSLIKNDEEPETFIKKESLIYQSNVLKYEILAVKKELSYYRQRLREMKFTLFKTGRDEPRFCGENVVIKGVKYQEGVWRIKLGSGKIDLSKVEFHGGGEVVGDIPKGLPSFTMPKFDLSAAVQLFPMAVIITLLGFMEAISIAKAMAAKTKQQLDPNQELIGQGLANIIGGFFKSYPVSGSFSRSAVNIQAGAVSGLSSVFTSLFVALTLMFLTPLLYYLPQSVLASIIIFAVIGLVNVKGFVHAWKAQRYDGVISVATFVLTLYFAPRLEDGIIIGVLASLVWFLIRNTKPAIAMLSKHTDGTFRNAERFGLKQCKHIALVRYHGSLFFANESYLDKFIMNLIEERKELRHIVIVGNGINEIDASGEYLLSDLIDRVRNMGIGFSMSGLNDMALDTMRRTFLYEKIGEENLFRNCSQAVKKLYAETHKDSDEKICPLLTPVFEDESKSAPDDCRDEIFNAR